MCLRRCVYAHGCMYQGTRQPQVQTVALTQESLDLEHVCDDPSQGEAARCSENSRNGDAFWVELAFRIRKSLTGGKTEAEGNTQVRFACSSAGWSRHHMGLSLCRRVGCCFGWLEKSTLEFFQPTSEYAFASVRMRWKASRSVSHTAD